MTAKPKSVFTDVNVEWAGNSFTIPAEGRLKLIREIEDVITVSEIAGMMMGTEEAKPARIASGYAIALRRAKAAEIRDGKVALVSDESVYSGMFGDGGADDMNAALAGLLEIMMPSAAFLPVVKPADQAEATDGNG